MEITLHDGGKINVENYFLETAMKNALKHFQTQRELKDSLNKARKDYAGERLQAEQKKIETELHGLTAKSQKAVRESFDSLIQSCEKMKAEYIDRSAKMSRDMLTPDF